MNILIIKFAALGDVLRTTTILTALKEKYPGSHISWLTEELSGEVLKDNAFIDKIYLYNNSLPEELLTKNFDLLINLDKDDIAISSSEIISSKIKKGFGKDKHGKVRPFDQDSEYAYRLGIDDELKFRINKKTYQQISFEQIGLTFKNQEYVFNICEKDKAAVREKLKNKGLSKDKIILGIVTGSGSGFCGKSLPDNYYAEIIDTLTTKNIQILLLGGPREMAKNQKIIKLINSKIIDTGCNNTINEYAAIIDHCDLILTGDTLTLHLAIALKKYPVVFFGSTSHQEIELYARGTKLLPSLNCAPCYKKICPKADEPCMKEFTPEKIVKEISAIADKLETKKRGQLK